MKQAESYRDALSTVDKDGKRVWVYPKKPSGRLHNYRSVVSTVLLLFMFGAPFLKIDGHPLFLFNIIERKFSFFGIPFWPQDFFLGAFAFITAVVLIIAFTVIYGRVFCGWICPQTIFMEFVFRKIEYLIEGDYSAQKKLSRMEWNTEKVFKKTLKHIIFYAIAFLVGNTFLAYIVGIDELYKIVSEPLEAHTSLFVTILICSAVFYWIFAFFREQVCTIACPYGRLQGVLTDKNTLVVAYDHVRGEERGKLRKNEERTIGDCIDCKQCVHVCPTGIDIRNGTQLECISCTACIDECNTIMDMIDKPRGLIRYASENNITEKTKFEWTVRVKAYTVVLFILMGLLASFLFMRSDVDATILRAPGRTFEVNGEEITNLYTFTLVNKTYDTIQVEVKVPIEGSKIQIASKNQLKLAPQGMIQNVAIVTIPRKSLKSLKTDIDIEIWDKTRKISSKEVTFLGPIK